MLSVFDSTTQISNLQLQIEAYITREKEEPPIDSEKPIQTKWFKPTLSDTPISVVLGPNNWLWLAAIISSSFLMFLLLLGIITRYYIYPIENKSEEVYHWTFKVLWFLFLLFAVVCICSSAVFLWWKRQNTLESKQIMNVEVPIPTRSPGSWIYGSERELESLPHQSLVQATNVHFGARPDLKSKFSGFFTMFGVTIFWFTISWFTYICRVIRIHIKEIRSLLIQNLKTLSL